MTKLSAGILLYRGSRPALELLLVHPGGPFWAKKDVGAWSIPKGEYAAGEDPLAVARREFAEELGSPPPQGECVDLGELKQPSRKIITAFAASRRLRSRHACNRTASSWNGRRRAGDCNPSPRSIAPNGSRSPRREERSSPARSPLSTGCSSSLRVVLIESCATFRARLPRVDVALAVAPAAGIVHFLPPTPELMGGRRIGH